MMGLMTTFLSTGEAARLLGASRQHVATLCDRGLIACTRTGAHRRILSNELERYVATKRDLDPSHLLLLWVSRASAAHVAADPESAFKAARRRLVQQAEREPHATKLIRAWRKEIKAGPEAVMRVLTSIDPDAITLQSISPFRFLPSQAERDRIVAAFNSWIAGQGGASAAR